jgi:hypothetical protein
MTINQQPGDRPRPLAGEVAYVRRPARVAKRRQATPSAGMTRAVAAIAAGAALQLGMSALGRKAVRGAASTAVRMLVPDRRSREPERAVVPAAPPERDTVIITETMVFRRIIVRRD